VEGWRTRSTTRSGDTRSFIRSLNSFYEHVENDERLRPMYPEDLTESKRHFELFLEQYWGGPKTYADERGHPRLRMRHAPFHITKSARDAWLSAMEAAMESVKSSLSDEQFIRIAQLFRYGGPPDAQRVNR
jgi:hemoglobin